MSKYGVEFEGSKAVAFIDSDEDGSKSVSLELFLAELVDEISKSEGGVVEKKFSFKMEGMNLVGEADLNKDGEPVAKINLNIAEAGDEILKLIIKK